MSKTAKELVEMAKSTENSFGKLIKLKDAVIDALDGAEIVKWKLSCANTIPDFDPPGTYND